MTKVALVDLEKLRKSLGVLGSAAAESGVFVDVEQGMKELTRSLPKGYTFSQIWNGEPDSDVSYRKEGWNEYLYACEHVFDKPPASKGPEEN